MSAPEAQDNLVQPLSEKREGSPYIIKTLILIVVLAGSLAAVRFSPIWHYLDRSNIYLIRDELTALHSLAPLVFLAGGAVVIAMGVPRTIISILGGVVFGFLFGTILATAAAFAGSVVVIWLTRVLGHPLFHQKIGHRLKAIEGHLRDNGFVLVLILRQLPLPSMLINVLIGLSSIKTSAYVLGSVIGLVPEAAVFALFGSSVRDDFALRISLASLCLVLLIIGIRIYFRRSPLARELSQNLTRDKG
ncbi:MAG TPA: VTT domain-containing protein [Thermodesulfovibrionales bacterium]|nr:VTT domain-containing protein [Thermodesulfovibrionales bacterium]